MPSPLFPRRAPATWREFFARVAAIALAAFLVLGAIDLFESLRSTHTPPRSKLYPHEAAPGQERTP